MGQTQRATSHGSNLLIAYLFIHLFALDHLGPHTVNKQTGHAFGNVKKNLQLKNCALGLANSLS